MLQRSSLAVFSAVVYALFLREVQTRFGTKKLGYLWAMTDSLWKILLFASLKAYIFGKAMPQIDYAVFIASGFLAFDLFRNMVSRSIVAFESNRGLFNYKQVKPIDTIVARFILECFIVCCAAMFLIFLGWYFEYDMQAQNLIYVLAAFCWIAVFAFGIGLLTAVVGSFFESFKKIMQLIMMPLFFLSALLYTVDSLPVAIQEVLLYNPVVHFIEMIHGNYFVVLDDRYVDYHYMLMWTIIPLFLGLWGYYKTEEKIIAS